jgi:hypothetical protein
MCSLRHCRWSRRPPQRFGCARVARHHGPERTAGPGRTLGAWRPRRTVVEMTTEPAGTTDEGAERVRAGPTLWEGASAAEVVGYIESVPSRLESLGDHRSSTGRRRLPPTRWPNSPTRGCFYSAQIGPRPPRGHSIPPGT